MSKSQFLEVLSEKLSEELSRSVVLSNLQYYESYIDGEVAKGRSMDEVMVELGDPYMIARTIIDAQTGESFADQNYAEDVYTEPVHNVSKQQETKGVITRNQGCLILVIIIIVILVVLAVLGSVISFLWPILGPILLVLLLVYLFKGKKQ